MNKTYLLFSIILLKLMFYTTRAQSNMEYVENYLSDHIGKKMCDWELSDLNGKVYSSKDFKGKILLLNFWGVGCGACIKIHDDLVDLQTKFKNKGLLLINIEITIEPDTLMIQKFLKKWRIFDNTLINGNEIGLKVGVAGARPTLILIDRNGKIVYGHIGLFYADTKFKMIEQIMKL